MLGRGLAITCSATIPDLHHFAGGGGKDVVPLYRTADASQANIAPGLLDLLSEEYGRPVSVEDVAAYIYGIMAHPAFTERFFRELESCELRVPFTRSADLFEAVRKRGAHLIWLHSWGERFVPSGKARGRIDPGMARCIRPVPSKKAEYPDAFGYDGATRTLSVGTGQFRPIVPDVYEFEVSGLKVVQSWLGYRMKERAGRTSSPLDEIHPARWTSRLTTELLSLLWVLEATVDGHPEQERLLKSVVDGECIQAVDLPPVPAEMRKAPAAPATPPPTTPPFDLSE